eukprot:TRINITY_DN4206_c0_g1_i2.p1 TRINITY_DN4206_c0_g1~~TRINITY_DN4206_c0_g1_i2.p1  ORF type:complete len:1027 (+),score=277.98 TRINITY_DN4206_c0_g1_i2:775-3855(+)
MRHGSSPQGSESELRQRMMRMSATKEQNRERERQRERELELERQRREALERKVTALEQQLVQRSKRAARELEEQRKQLLQQQQALTRDVRERLNSGERRLQDTSAQLARARERAKLVASERVVEAEQAARAEMEYVWHQLATDAAASQGATQRHLVAIQCAAAAVEDAEDACRCDLRAEHGGGVAELARDLAGAASLRARTSERAERAARRVAAWDAVTQQHDFSLRAALTEEALQRQRLEVALGDDVLHAAAGLCHSGFRAASAALQQNAATRNAAAAEQAQLQRRLQAAELALEQNDSLLQAAEEERQQQARWLQTVVQDAQGSVGETEARAVQAAAAAEHAVLRAEHLETELLQSAEARQREEVCTAWQRALLIAVPLSGVARVAATANGEAAGLAADLRLQRTEAGRQAEELERVHAKVTAMEEELATAREVAEVHQAHPDEQSLQLQVLHLQEQLAELMLERQQGEVQQAAAAAVSDRAECWDTGRVAEAAEVYDATRQESTTLEDLSAVLRRLMAMYDRKAGDVADELVTNLRFPPRVTSLPTQELREAASLEVLSATAHAAASLQGTAEDLPAAAAAEVLALRLYTERPIDIDRDLGWRDVPPPPKASDDLAAAAQRLAYEARHEDWDWSSGGDKRNGSVFHPVCRALRSAVSDSEADAVLEKWVKWLCTVAAVCAEGVTEPAEVWRGLGGGGLPASVVAAHRKLGEGDLLGWPALSSASHDRTASEQYMHGTAANACGRPTPQRPGTILFRMSDVRTGKEISCVSAYPNERERLLGPLTLFRVLRNTSDDANRFGQGLLIDLQCLGPLGADAGLKPELQQTLSDFFRRVRSDAVNASREKLRPAEGAAARLLRAEQQLAELESCAVELEESVSLLRAGDHGHLPGVSGVAKLAFDLLFILRGVRKRRRLLRPEQLAAAAVAGGLITVTSAQAVAPRAFAGRRETAVVRVDATRGWCVARAAEAAAVLPARPLAPLARFRPASAVVPQRGTSATTSQAASSLWCVAKAAATAVPRPPGY